MIKLDGVTRVYGRGEAATNALLDVSLEVPQGTFVTVVGTSGSGKTTLLNILGGLDTDFSGTATVAGHDLKKMTDRQLSRFRSETVSFVFQHFNLLDHLDAVQNVALPAFFSPRDDQEILPRAEEVLVRVGLAEKLHSFPSQLSGGQKQRVAIARALFSKPRVILADEPTGNLDTRTSGQIIALFESLNREDRITVVAVTHEDFLFANASQKVRLEDGRLVEGEQK